MTDTAQTEEMQGVEVEQYWSAERNSQFKPPWIIRYDPMPGGKLNADGSRSFSMNFPVIQMTEWVAEPEKVAEAIAAVLNKHVGKM